MDDTAERKRHADNLVRLCGVKVKWEDYSANQLKNFYTRASIAKSLKDNCGVKVDWRKISIKALQDLYVEKSKRKNKVRPTTKSKMARAVAGDVQLCSEGLMIKVAKERYLLVEMDAGQFKEHAKSTFRHGNSMKAEK